MSKLKNFSNSFNIAQKNSISTDAPTGPKPGFHALNTLAQLDQNTSQVKTKKNFQDPLTGNSLAKRARAKTLSNKVAEKLAGLRTPLQKSYKSSIACAAALSYRNGKITGRYCNQRWCLVCSRIRTAKLLNGYKPVFDSFHNPHFLTFTVKNCSGTALPATLERMNTVWTKIKRSIKRTHGIKVFRAVRKIECTYNTETGEFHPHFHVIADLPWSVCLLMQDMWLDNWPGTIRRAQDIRKADKNAVVELFKYFTKIVTKKGQGTDRKIIGVHTKPLDTIFQCIKGKRTFQGYGVKKVSEDIEEIQAEDIENWNKTGSFFEWKDNDWIDQHTGEILSGYEPSVSMKYILDRVE